MEMLPVKIFVAEEPADLFFVSFISPSGGEAKRVLVFARLRAEAEGVAMNYLQATEGSTPAGCKVAVNRASLPLKLKG
jgi:hypothetical protein